MDGSGEFTQGIGGRPEFRLGGRLWPGAPVEAGLIDRSFTGLKTVLFLPSKDSRT
jgi:hypothetical protein